jgi:hypothetical protein
MNFQLVEALFSTFVFDFDSDFRFLLGGFSGGVIPEK